LYLQVLHCEKYKIPAVVLSGDKKTMTDIQNEMIKLRPKFKIIYMTPEKFNSQSMIRILMSVEKANNLSHIVFDEAHCISLWGDSFRHSYLAHRKLLCNVYKNVPVMMLTASATPDRREKILKNLGFEKHEVKFFLKNFNRPNLQYECVCINENDRMAVVSDTIKKPGYIGILLIFDILLNT
jgi:bloom syndrome protein